MRIDNFSIGPDLVPPRIEISWDFVLEGADTLASIPPVSIRRKERDFSFPAPPVGSADPFGVYDSSAFPAAGATVTELPGWEERIDGQRTVTTVESASLSIGGNPVEITRRTTETTFAETGTPLRRHVEILDVGPLPLGLQARTTYYYQLFSPALPPTADPAAYRGSARTSSGFGLGRAMYESLPPIYTRHDVVMRPRTDGADGVPEAAQRGGQLKRFLDLFGSSLDLMRGSAEDLRDLHAVDDTDSRFLAHLAGWLGWDLSFRADIPIQRSEIKYAADLYRITSTIPGCVVWVKRLTGWPCRVKEFYPNVFFSNDVGTSILQRPSDPGSRTVNTADAGLLGGIGTPDDNLDYTYDTGTDDDDWYAYNAVGLFIELPANEPDSEVARKRDRLKRNLSMFLPVNVRGVVILTAPTLVEAPVQDQFDFRAPIVEGGGP